MTDDTIHTEDADHRRDAAVPDRLGTARGVLADIAQHSARDAQAACRVVLERSDDPDERKDAQGLLQFLTRDGEADR